MQTTGITQGYDIGVPVIGGYIRVIQGYIGLGDFGCILG